MHQAAGLFNYLWGRHGYVNDPGGNPLIQMQNIYLQRQLIDALCDSRRYPHAAKNLRLIETHISWVLLAGRYAYKIKKAVDLGFLDFTDLESRRFYCEEEIRLNRRFAPQIYLDIVTIGGSPQQPELGARPAIEYAVKMRRFPSTRLMDRMLTRGLLTPAHIDSLAATLVRFHANLPPPAPYSEFGSLQEIHAPAMQNFDQLSPLLSGAEVETLASLRQASEDEYSFRTALFEQRRLDGRIRECHGDLHLGNIALIRNEPVPFDGIEFNPGLRWIDVMNEVAFLVMDLLHRNRPDLAFRFLNAYLEATGDYQGVGVLRFYLAYRAMVRAKIDAIRARLPDAPPAQAKFALAACRGYLNLAESCLARGKAMLVITHGLPGCGKTTVTQAALERLHAIRIRSDIERKRLFGLAPLQPSGSAIGDGIYGAEATKRTYARLYQMARGLLDAGFPVIVDAAFLMHAERAQFRLLAQEMAVPFVILDVQASSAALRRRILRRQEHGRDASEADLEVLQTLQAAQEPLLAEESPLALEVVNEGEIAALNDRLAAAWKELEGMVA
jgi:uncharacterized protein